MIALWRHDRRWLGTFLVLLLATFALAWSAKGGDSTWIPGMENNGEDVRWTVLAAAFVLGVYATARERLWGTQELLLHRAVPSARLLAARALACAFVLGLSVAAALAASRAGWLDDFAHPEVWTSTWMTAHVAALAGALPALAAGACVGVLVHGVAQGLLVLIGLGVPVLWFSRACLDAPQLMADGADHVAPEVYVLTQVLAALPLAWLAVARFGRPPDAHEGRAGRRPVLLAALLIVGWVPLGARALRHAEDGTYALTVATWPDLYVTSTGAVLRLVPSRRRRAAYFVDEHHHAVATPHAEGGAARDRRSATELAFALSSPARRGRARRPWHRAPTHLVESLRETVPLVPSAPVSRWRSLYGGDWLVHLRTVPGARATEVLRLAGTIRLVIAQRRGEPTSSAWTLARPDGRPVVVTDMVRATGTPGTHLVVDGSDGTVWDLDTHAPGAVLHPFPQPPEGRVVGLESVIATRPDAPSKRVEQVVALTEGGRYAYQDGEWEATAPAAPAAQADAAFESRHVGDDPFDAGLELVDPHGNVVASHRYRPLTDRERRWALVTRATTVALPPAALLVARGQGVPDGTWLEPLTASGQHDLLVVLGALLAVVLAACTRRRLRRLEVPAPLRRLWVGAVLLGGPVAFVLHHALVRRRAWHPRASSIRARARKLPTPRPAIDRTLRPAGGTTGGVA